MKNIDAESTARYTYVCKGGIAVKRNLLKANILFPMVILCAAAVILTIALLLPRGKTFTAVQTDAPGYAQVYWADISEEEFYKHMSVAMRVCFEEKPTYYNLTDAGSELTFPIAVYEVSRGDALAYPRIKHNLESEVTFKIHSVPEAFSRVSIGEDAPLFLVMLKEQQDVAGFEKNPEYAPTYYKDYFGQFGYAVITPSCSIIPMEGSDIKSELLPDYLRGEGEYTSMDELREILYQGRLKYGMSEYGGL